MKQRLDQELVRRKLVASRSQAESYIRLGQVLVGGRVVAKAGHFVSSDVEIILSQDEQYVSRAGLKLASVAGRFGLDFTDKVVLDIGSSTGGFTDYALRRGVRKVIAVDVGTDQLHPSLRSDPRVELYEKTDIRRVIASGAKQSSPLDRHADKSARDDTTITIEKPDIILIDVSFISIREILGHVAQYLATPDTLIVAMVKPQFETGARSKHSGVIKNSTERRQILKDFELWAKNLFYIEQKSDSQVAGAKGNLERLYVLKRNSTTSSGRIR
jgi:23S rRNA (cytidine1920-2'-O)/16S rRNA (cytidine1409-2'-O)-methyltransferase